MGLRAGRRGRLRQPSARAGRLGLRRWRWGRPQRSRPNWFRQRHCVVCACGPGRGARVVAQPACRCANPRTAGPPATRWIGAARCSVATIAAGAGMRPRQHLFLALAASGSALKECLRGVVRSLGVFVPRRLGVNVGLTVRAPGSASSPASTSPATPPSPRTTAPGLPPRSACNATRAARQPSRPSHCTSAKEGCCPKARPKGVLHRCKDQRSPRDAQQNGQPA